MSIHYDDKYLLKKADEKSEEFNNLLFAVGSIKEISIPSNIKSISSYTLYQCMNLNKAEIPQNSNL